MEMIANWLPWWLVRILKLLCRDPQTQLPAFKIFSANPWLVTLIVLRQTLCFLNYFWYIFSKRFSFFTLKCNLVPNHSLESHVMVAPWKQTRRPGGDGGSDLQIPIMFLYPLLKTSKTFSCVCVSGRPFWNTTF